MIRLPKPSWRRFITLRNINFVLFLAVLGLLSIVLFVGVDVLACPDNRRNQCQGDFYVHVDDSKQYKIGSEIIVTSEFLKKRTSSGEAKRYIECQNPDGQFSNRFPIGESTADQQTGTSARQVHLRVPLGVQAPLPATCRITINIEYPISRLRDLLRGKHFEIAHSNTFTVINSEIPIVELHIKVDGNTATVESSNPGTFTRQIPVAPGQNQRIQLVEPNEAESSNPPDNKEPEETPPTTPRESILPGEQPPVVGCVDALGIGACL